MPEETENIKTEETQLDRAERIANNLAQQNKAMEANLERAERLKATQLVGGTADAGQAPPEVKEETAKEYKDRIMRGG